MPRRQKGGQRVLQESTENHSCANPRRTDWIALQMCLRPLLAMPLLERSITFRYEFSVHMCASAPVPSSVDRKKKGSQVIGSQGWERLGRNVVQPLERQRTSNVVVAQLQMLHYVIVLERLGNGRRALCFGKKKRNDSDETQAGRQTRHARGRGFAHLDAKAVAVENEALFPQACHDTRRWHAAKPPTGIDVAADG